MDAGYQGSVHEADFQKLAQNIGTNIQKILQNGNQSGLGFPKGPFINNVTH